MVNDYNEELHQYTYRGKVVPSVTQIADPISFVKLDALDKLMLQHSAERGSIIHELCQMFALEKEYPDDVNEEVRPYFDAFVQWFFDFNVEAKYVELGMWCKDFAGRCDLIAIINGEVYLIDIKTTSSINKKPLRVQMAGYSILAKEGEAMNGLKLNLHIDHTAVLHLTNKGEYEFKLVPPNYDHFNALLNHQKYMQGKEEIWKSIKPKNQ